MQYRHDHVQSSAQGGSGETGTGSNLGRFARLRSASHSASKPVDPARDEWLIPYNGPVTTAAPTAAVPLGFQSSNATTRPAAHQASLAAPTPRGMQGGIGESPAPAHRSGGGLSAFWESLSGGGSGSSSSQGYGRSSDESVRRRKTSSRRQVGEESYAFPKQKASGTGHGLFHRHPRSSNGSMDFQDYPPTNMSRSRLPSSSSVPTGLAAPPLLFSPTHRGLALRASGSVPDLRESMLRGSADSLPLPVSNRSRVTSKKWIASTACDTFVLPRPKLVAHTITPPISPERKGKALEQPGDTPSPVPSDAQVLQEGDAREREREDWARKARGRGRSLSFSSLGRSELAGSSLINVRSRSKSQTRSRTASMGTGKDGKARSSSFSSRWKGSARNSAGDTRRSETNGVQSRQNSQRSNATVTERQCGYQGGIQPALAHDPSQHSQSGHSAGRAPSLMNDRDTEDPFQSRQAPHDQAALAIDPTRSEGRNVKGVGRELRFKQVAPVDAGGVVIISHPTTGGNQPDGRRRTVSSASANKPLPALPPNAQRPISPPTKTLSQEIGIAISPDLDCRLARKPIPALLPEETPLRPPSSSAHARSLLQREHQRSMTKRAFLAPSFGSRPPSLTSPHTVVNSPRTPTGATWQPRHQASSSVSSVPLSPSPSARKRSTMEEAVGRGRAASAGHNSRPADLYPASPVSRYSNSESLIGPEHRVQILAAAGMLAEPEHGSSTPAKSVAPVIVPLGASINTETPQRPTSDNISSHASSISSADWLSPQNSLLRAALDASSPLTAGHSSTSSPIQTFEEDDYKNLFYNAPTRRPNPLASQVASQKSPLTPTYRAPAGHGLGFDMRSETADSDSVDGSVAPSRSSEDVSEGTMELATPIHATSMYEKQQSTSSRSSAVGPASIQGTDQDPRSFLPPTQIVDQDEYASSNDDSPPMLESMPGYGRPELSHARSNLTHSSSEMTVQEDDASVRFSHVSVGQAIHIATPPMPSEEQPRHVRRTSVIPERGSSSQDDLLKASVPSMPPVSSYQFHHSPHKPVPEPHTPRQSFHDDRRRNSAAVSFIHEFPSPPRNPAATGMVRRDTFGTWDELANLSREPPPADESDDELAAPPRLNRLESDQSTATVDSYATAREGFTSSVEG